LRKARVEMPKKETEIVVPGRGGEWRQRDSSLGGALKSETERKSGWDERQKT